MKWDGIECEMMEGPTDEQWQFPPDSLPWLCPSQKGIQICVADWTTDAHGGWSNIVVGLWLEDLLPSMLNTFAEEPDDVAHLAATAESLDRMAAAIRARVKTLAGTTAPEAA